MLIILGGLPGVGKSTLARALARQIGATHVRIDAIEMSLREAGALVGPMDDRPTWDEVLARDYAPWDRENVVIDTARCGVEQSVRTVRELLDRR